MDDAAAGSNDHRALLTQDTVCAYVTAHQKEIGVFEAEATLRAQEVTGGNLNFSFQVTNEKQSVFVKQV